MKLTRHVGLDKATNQRIILLYSILPNTQDCLIAFSEGLPAELKEAVFQVQNADEGQRAINLLDVLGRRVFSDTQKSIAEILHVHNYIKKVNIDTVLMTPSTIYKIPLRDVLVQSGLLSQPVTPVPESAGSEKFNPHLYNADAANQGEAFGIARNLLAEAVMLEEAAKAKREEAYRYAPSLHPMNTDSGGAPYVVPEVASAVTEPVAIQVADTLDETKTA